METLQNIWTDYRMDRLEALYRNGLSFSLIADDIGVTRNAAIGKARRMQLPKRVEIVASKASRPARKPPKKRNRKASVDVPQVPATKFIRDHDYSCSINDLEDCSCRFPLWEPRTPHPHRLYCGFPDASVSAGLPYCRRHALLCETQRQH